MSSCTDPLDKSFLNLPNDEKLSVCKTWLDNNQSHSMRHLVEYIKQIEENSQLNKIVDQRSLRILLEKYPKLIDRTLSSFFWPEKSPHSDVSQENIGDELFQSVDESFMSNDYWTAPYILPLGNNCDHEDDCTFAVKKLLESNLIGLKLDKIIEVLQKRSLAGAECDLLLVYKPNRLPFAALEIKKAPNTAEERDCLFHGSSSEESTSKENKVAGEVWAEINGVRLFGFHKVYGMISTSNQFRLVCTDKINDEADNLDAMKESWEQLKERNKNFEDQEEGDESSNQIVTSPGRKSVQFLETSGADRTKAKLFASQIIPNLDDDKKVIVPVEKSGQEILRLVALFILKACTTLTNLLEKGGASKDINIYEKMPCRIISDKEKEFSFGTVALTALNLNVFINTNKTKTIYVIRHLGMGNSGNCCLGVSKSGKSSCAVKFYHTAAEKKQTKELAGKEYRNWQNIYGNPDYGPPMSQKLKLVEGFCLVMPYLKPIPESDRHTLLEKRDGDKESRIEETLRKFTESGYKHEDIKWRHFGFWKGEIFLLDLEKVAKVKKNEVDSWVTKTVKKLREKLKKAKTPVAPKNAGKAKTPETPKNAGKAKTPKTLKNTRKLKAKTLVALKNAGKAKTPETPKNAGNAETPKIPKNTQKLKAKTQETPKNTRKRKAPADGTVKNKKPPSIAQGRTKRQCKATRSTTAKG